MLKEVLPQSKEGATQGVRSKCLLLCFLANFVKVVTPKHVVWWPTHEPHSCKHKSCQRASSLGTFFRSFCHGLTETRTIPIKKMTVKMRHNVSAPIK